MGNAPINCSEFMFIPFSVLKDGMAVQRLYALHRMLQAFLYRFEPSRRK